MGRPDPADSQGHERLIGSPVIGPPVLRLSLPLELASVRVLGTALRLFGRQHFPHHVEGQELHDLRLAAQEAAANIIEHDVVRNPENRIQVMMQGAPDGISVQIQNAGPPFDPTKPDAAPPDPEELAEGGYGLFLINSLVDEIAYETVDDFNCLTLTKKWNAPGNP